jgi:DNA-binding transcriptional ArsR family regulator
MKDRRSQGPALVFMAMALVLLFLASAPASASVPTVRVVMDQQSVKADLSLGVGTVVKYSGNISIEGAKANSGTITAEVIGRAWDVTISPDKFGPVTGDTLVPFTGKVAVPLDTVQSVYHLKVTVNINVPSSDPPAYFVGTESIIVIKNRVDVQAPIVPPISQANVTQVIPLSFKVTNRGSTADNFGVQISRGLELRDRGWLVDLMGGDKVGLGPDESTYVNLDITIPANATNDTYQLTLFVQSSNAPDSAGEATANVIVQGGTPPVATPHGQGWAFLGLGYFGWSMISIAVIGVCMIVVVGGTEVGYFAFLVWIFVPLYCRIMKEKVLDNFTRGEIYGYIKANPGAHYMELQNQLDLPNGVLAHHLMVLEREEFVKVYRDGFYKRFYPKHIKAIRKEKHLSRIQRQLMDEVDRHPGISQKTLASYVQESKQVISYHIKVLQKAGFVTVEKEGGISKVFSVKGMWPAKDVEVAIEAEEIVPAEAAPAVAGDSGRMGSEKGHIGRI